MDNPFAEFENEEIYINRKDGTRTGPHKASFDQKLFSVSTDDLDVEEGDTIDRPISSKKSERYPVLRVEFNKKFHDIPAHFNVHVRGTAAVVDTPKTIVTNYNIHNSHGFQIGDHNTQHIVDGFKTLIMEIAKSPASQEEKKEAKGKIADLLEHPLTSAILGGAVGGLAGLL